tara:strand:+ start:2549 stop:3511 length:963 start_codon:yes stop_codon:yes gene_type:complete
VKFDDKRIESLAHVTLKNSRIVLTQPILFLCGGQIDIKSVEPLSVRGALVDHLHSVGCDLAQGITLAEEFADWIHDSNYRDLLVFESDIAHISSLIVIILESAGALTELGLFVKNKALRNKILVFVRQDHYEQNSFVRLGPLRHLEDIKETSVCAYPWDQDNIKKSLAPSLQEMREDILGAVANQDKSEIFNEENDGHISFVIYEVIKTFRALKLLEIESYLAILKLEISREKLRRLLFLLGKFNLVGCSKRGHVYYYYAATEILKVEFAGKFDQTTAKIAAMQFYINNDGESKRVNVIQAAYKQSVSGPAATSSNGTGS